jgi:hypothetical protein
VVETLDGDELDRLLLDEALVPVATVGLTETVESAVAPRIAAAATPDWDGDSSASVHDSETGPPIAAS